MLNQAAVLRLAAASVWPCPVCPQKFPSLSSAETHQRLKSHCFCESCDQVFRSKTQFEEHKAVEELGDLSSNSEYVTAPEIDENDAVAITTDILDTEIQESCDTFSAPLTIDLTCTRCKRRFKSREGLERHVASKHHGMVICLFCKQYLNDHNAYRLHRPHCKHQNPSIHQKALPETLGKCVFCLRTFKSLFALCNHLDSSAHAAKNKRIKCGPGCERHMESFKALIDHTKPGKCSSQLGRYSIVVNAITQLKVAKSYSKVSSTRTWKLVSAPLALPEDDCQSLFCAEHNKRFKSQDALNAHLDSPAHYLIDLDG